MDLREGETEDIRTTLAKFLPWLDRYGETSFKIGKMGKFDRVIYCGDLAECVYNECGMITEKDMKEMERFKAFIELEVGVKRENIHYLPGDPEPGYILPLSCDPKGGISGKSIDNFQLVFGPLFQTFAIGTFNFVLLSSSLLSQPTDHLSDDDEKFVSKLKDDQFICVWNFLSDKEKNGVTFVFLHDPDGIEIFNSYVFSLMYLKIENTRFFADICMRK